LEVFELQEAADFGKGFGDVGPSVVADNLTGFNVLAVEPGHGPASEADDRGLLFVSEILDLG